jgi:L-ribulokinase
VLTSGLVEKNALLLDIMTDVLARPVEVPMIANATAVGSAIHGAVAGRVVQDFAEGTKRFGAKDVLRREPRRENTATYDKLYRTYRALADDVMLRQAMNRLNDLKL